VQSRRMCSRRVGRPGVARRSQRRPTVARATSVGGPARLVQTCQCHPSQWEGWTSNGSAIYVRFRHGRLWVGLAPDYRRTALTSGLVVAMATFSTRPSQSRSGCSPRRRRTPDAHPRRASRAALVAASAVDSRPRKRASPTRPCPANRRNKGQAPGACCCRALRSRACLSTREWSLLVPRLNATRRPQRLHVETPSASTASSPDAPQTFARNWSKAPGCQSVR
jgi:hypothetical protein